MKNNKEITAYELMGLIKDGKAPKKIRYRRKIYYWSYDTYTEYISTPDAQFSLFQEYRIDYCLNDTVEILEENDEWVDIEEINIENDGHNDFIKNEHGTKCGLTKHSKIIAEKVNKLIKNQKYLKERLDKNELR